MILTDSSVLVDFLRTKEAKLDQLFRARPVAVCGIVRAEILAGARGATDRQRLSVFLQPFRHVSMPDSSWDAVGDNRAACFASGLTVPFADVVIATLGIQNDIEVWARDPHFAMMKAVLPALKLFQEPP